MSLNFEKEEVLFMCVYFLNEYLKKNSSHMILSDRFDWLSSLSNYGNNLLSTFSISSGSAEEFPSLINQLPNYSLEEFDRLELLGK